MTEQPKTVHYQPLDGAAREMSFEEFVEMLTTKARADAERKARIGDPDWDDFNAFVEKTAGDKKQNGDQ